LEKTIVMFTGVPGSGKTTVLDVMDKRLSHHIRPAVIGEYGFVQEWAGLPENRRFLQVPPPSFVLELYGYRPMSTHVAERLAQSIENTFKIGFEMVMFETARGVGDPLVTYADFVTDIYRNLSRENRTARLVNYEVLADANDIARRMATRFEEDPTATPPGVEKRYLSAEGFPLVYSTQDLRRLPEDIPIVINESLQNGHTKEGIESMVDLEIFPRFQERLQFMVAQESGSFGGRRETR